MKQIPFVAVLVLAVLGACSDMFTAARANQASSSLICSLRSVGVLSNGEFRGDFVLQNVGTNPIYLYERWNRWGARQWRIRVSDESGSVRIHVNPHDTWFRNYPSTFMLGPGKELVTPCALINREYLTTATGERDGMQIFVSMPENSRDHPGIGRKADPVDWHSPVTLVGIFESSVSEQLFKLATEARMPEDRVKFPSWEGTIQTAQVKINLPENR